MKKTTEKLSVEDLMKWSTKDFDNAELDDKLRYYQWYLDHTSVMSESIRKKIMEHHNHVYNSSNEEE